MISVAHKVLVMNQMISNTISILLLLGGGVPQRGEVVGKKRIPY